MGQPADRCGAEELHHGEMPGGRVLHAQLRIADSFLLVSLGLQQFSSPVPGC